jgi:hypothetical protein
MQAAERLANAETLMERARHRAQAGAAAQEQRAVDVEQD